MRHRGQVAIYERRRAFIFFPPHFRYWIGLLAIMSLGWEASAFGQGTTVVELYGVVQVAPGPTMITFEVLGEEIRFGLQDIQSVDRQLSKVRLLSDIKNREPSLYLKGPAHILEILLREKPEKRMLKIVGVYYPASRTFNVSDIEPFRAPEKRF